MSRRLCVLVCAAVVWSATPAWAQAPAAASTPRIGVRAFGHFEWQTMAAKETFDAVTGKSTLTGLGGGVEVQRIWRGIFARAAISRMSQSGQRIFVFDNTVFPLGVPLDITMTPIEFAAGWRFSPIGSRGIVGYLGAGGMSLSYNESSPSDAAGEEVSEKVSGFLLFGGVEVPVWRFVTAGAEVGWRKAEVLNPGGAMGAFDENDFGGVTMRVMVSIRR